MKTGVYLCQCGGNISNTIDLQKIAKHIKEKKNDILVQENSHMCSGAGQKVIIEDIKTHKLEKVVIANCCCSLYPSCCIAPEGQTDAQLPQPLHKAELT